MNVRLFAAGIGLSVLMTQAATAAEINAFGTGAARRPYETLARNSSAPPDTSSSASSSCRPP